MSMGTAGTFFKSKVFLICLGTSLLLTIGLVGGTIWSNSAMKSSVTNVKKGIEAESKTFATTKSKEYELIKNAVEYGFIAIRYDTAQSNPTAVLPKKDSKHKKADYINAITALESNKDKKTSKENNVQSEAKNNETAKEKNVQSDAKNNETTKENGVKSKAAKEKNVKSEALDPEAKKLFTENLIYNFVEGNENIETITLSQEKIKNYKLIKELGVFEKIGYKFFASNADIIAKFLVQLNEDLTQTSKSKNSFIILSFDDLNLKSYVINYDKKVEVKQSSFQLKDGKKLLKGKEIIENLLVNTHEPVQIKKAENTPIATENKTIATPTEQKLETSNANAGTLKSNEPKIENKQVKSDDKTVTLSELVRKLMDHFKKQSSNSKLDKDCQKNPEEKKTETTTKTSDQETNKNINVNNTTLEQSVPVPKDADVKTSNLTKAEVGKDAKKVEVTLASNKTSTTTQQGLEETQMPTFTPEEINEIFKNLGEKIANEFKRCQNGESSVLLQIAEQNTNNAQEQNEATKGKKEPIANPATTSELDLSKTSAVVKDDSNKKDEQCVSNSTSNATSVISEKSVEEMLDAFFIKTKITDEEKKDISYHMTRQFLKQMLLTQIPKLQIPPKQEENTTKNETSQTVDTVNTVKQSSIFDASAIKDIIEWIIVLKYANPDYQETKPDELYIYLEDALKHCVTNHITTKLNLEYNPEHVFIGDMKKAKFAQGIVKDCDFFSTLISSLEKIKNLDNDRKFIQMHSSLFAFFFRLKKAFEDLLTKEKCTALEKKLENYVNCVAFYNINLITDNFEYIFETVPFTIIYEYLSKYPNPNCLVKIAKQQTPFISQLTQEVYNNACDNDLKIDRSQKEKSHFCKIIMQINEAINFPEVFNQITTVLENTAKFYNLTFETYDLLKKTTNTPEKTITFVATNENKDQRTNKPQLIIIAKPKVILNTASTQTTLDLKQKQLLENIFMTFLITKSTRSNIKQDKSMAKFEPIQSAAQFMQLKYYYDLSPLYDFILKLFSTKYKTAYARTNSIYESCYNDVMKHLTAHYIRNQITPNYTIRYEQGQKKIAERVYKQIKCEKAFSFLKETCEEYKKTKGVSERNFFRDQAVDFYFKELLTKARTIFEKIDHGSLKKKIEDYQKYISCCNMDLLSDDFEYIFKTVPLTIIHRQNKIDGSSKTTENTNEIPEKAELKNSVATNSNDEVQDEIIIELNNKITKLEENVSQLIQEISENKQCDTKEPKDQ